MVLSSRVPCEVRSCRARSCHVMSCYVMSCLVLSCRVVSRHLMSLIRAVDRSRCKSGSLLLCHVGSSSRVVDPSCLFVDNRDPPRYNGSSSRAPSEDLSRHVTACVMSCYVMSCHVVSYHVMSCRVVSRHLMSLTRGRGQELLTGVVDKRR